MVVNSYQFITRFATEIRLLRNVEKTQVKMMTEK